MALPPRGLPNLEESSNYDENQIHDPGGRHALKKHDDYASDHAHHHLNNRGVNHAHHHLNNHGVNHAHHHLNNHGVNHAHHQLGNHGVNHAHHHLNNHGVNHAHHHLNNHGVNHAHHQLGNHGVNHAHHQLGNHGVNHAHYQLGNHGVNHAHYELGNHGVNHAHYQLGNHSVNHAHYQLGNHGLKTGGRFHVENRNKTFDDENHPFDFAAYGEGGNRDHNHVFDYSMGEDKKCIRLQNDTHHDRTSGPVENINQNHHCMNHCIQDKNGNQPPSSTIHSPTASCPLLPVPTIIPEAKKTKERVKSNEETVESNDDKRELSNDPLSTTLCDVVSRHGFKRVGLITEMDQGEDFTSVLRSRLLDSGCQSVQDVLSSGDDGQTEISNLEQSILPCDCFVVVISAERVSQKFELVCEMIIPQFLDKSGLFILATSQTKVTYAPLELTPFPVFVENEGIYLQASFPEPRKINVKYWTSGQDFIKDNPLTCSGKVRILLNDSNITEAEKTVLLSGIYAVNVAFNDNDISAGEWHFHEFAQKLHSDSEFVIVLSNDKPNCLFSYALMFLSKETGGQLKTQGTNLSVPVI